ncbi:MAG: GIY-YIG nuclease family protein [Rhodospirillales bacterium]|nr:GIY-YIG nuclease family protein [Rhodospirillales bacterium]
MKQRSSERSDIPRPRSLERERGFVLAYRKKQLKGVSDETGVYALCDLDETPIYVGQSRDGIRSRASRHLTSARSDIIANRQIDVWEIAYIWAWPMRDVGHLDALEAYLFYEFHQKSSLMNGSTPPESGKPKFQLPKKQIIQLLSDEEIGTRLDPSLRLPRQVEHIGRLIDHILNVKDSSQLRTSLKAHFARLERYKKEFLEPNEVVIRNHGQKEEEPEDE